MHSVRRVRTTAEQQAARRAREAGEIKAHKTLLSKILERDLSDPQALNRTTDLLSYYPDQYTVWNIRREILSFVKAHPPETTENEKPKMLSYPDLLMYELKFTQSLLPEHPKVYWIWNHRRWVLDQLPPVAAFEGEMGLTTKLLQRDARNFHGWGYRWYVLNRLRHHYASTGETSASADEGSASTGEGSASEGDEAMKKIYDAEFEFTTKKINANFSNFSAWHYRAQLIPLVTTKPTLDSELEYVFTAVSMDPADQSGWLYYQWLLESPLFSAETSPELYEDQLEQVTELFDDEKSVWAARSIAWLSAKLDKPQDLGAEMAKLDSLRKNRYLTK